MIGRSSGQKKRSASSMTINWHWLLGWMKNLSTSRLVEQQEEQWKVREKKECRILESSFHQKVLCKKCSLEECCLKRSYLFKGSDGPNRGCIIYIYINIISDNFDILDLTLATLEEGQQVFSSWIMKSNFSKTLIPATHALSWRDHNRAV